MDLNVFAIVIVVVLFVVIFLVGLVAGRSMVGQNPESYVLAGRQLSLFVAATSMAATSVCGGYINGTAESVYKDGVLWTLAPPGIAIGLCTGGILFAKAMRSRQYLTMLDPLAERYGNRTVALLFLASLFGDLLWSASVLAALGTTLKVLLGIPVEVAVPCSALLTIIYTFFGQMLAVAYTDVIQMFTVLFGLWLGFGLMLTKPAVPLFEISTSQQNHTNPTWLGELNETNWLEWADLALAMALGSIPWQAYFQRVLSTRTPLHAQLLSFVAGFSALAVAVPCGIVGAAAQSANWTGTDLGRQLGPTDAPFVLPLSFRYLSTSDWAGVAGLAAIAAGVFSSMDSAILGSSSMFTHNIYRPLFRNGAASNRELLWVQRFAVLAVGAVATLLAVLVSSVYAMFALAADLVYCLMLPQLTVALFFPWANFAGSVSTFIAAVVARVLAGDPGLGLPPVIPYPTNFPHRTLVVVVSLATIPLVSSIYSKRMSIFGTKLCENNDDKKESRDNTIISESSQLNNDQLSRLLYSSVSYTHTSIL